MDSIFNVNQFFIRGGVLVQRLARTASDGLISGIHKERFLGFGIDHPEAFVQIDPEQNKVIRGMISLFGRLMHFLSLKFRVETEHFLDALLENHSVNFGLRKYVAEKKRDSTLTDDSAFARFVSETLEDEFTIPVDEVRGHHSNSRRTAATIFPEQCNSDRGGGGRSFRCVADLSLFDGRARSLSFDTELLLRVAVDRTLRSAGHRHRAGFEPSFKIAAPTSRKRFQRILQTRELAR